MAKKYKVLQVGDKYYLPQINHKVEACDTCDLREVCLSPRKCNDALIDCSYVTHYDAIVNMFWKEITPDAIQIEHREIIKVE